LAEAHLFSVIVIDTVVADWGNQAARSVTAKNWVRGVRRLAMSIAGTTTRVILLTNQAVQRPLPLPVALRLELQRLADDRLSVAVSKDKRGRIRPARVISLVSETSSAVSAPERVAQGSSTRSNDEAKPHLHIVPRAVAS
jgi:recombination protein RecA